MIRGLRQGHRRVIFLLAFALPPAYVAGLLLRAPPAVMDSLPAALASDAGRADADRASAAAASPAAASPAAAPPAAASPAAAPPVLLLVDAWADGQLRLSRSHRGAQPTGLIDLPLDPVPDPLLYAVGAPVVAGGSLPSDAVLLGRLSGEPGQRFALLESVSHVAVYSLGYQQVVASFAARAPAP